MKYLKILIPSVLLFTGCSTKVFEPQKVEHKKLPQKEIYKNLTEYTKKSFTFTRLQLKYVKKQNFLDDGVRGVYVNYDLKNHKLGKYVKINKDLAAYGKNLLVISQKKIYKLPFVIFSATRRNNEVAVVFDNGKYGVYDLKTKEMKYIFDGDQVLSVRYLHAAPLFYNDLILYPLLSGNVAVVDDKSGQFIRTLNISQNQFNDNVIFLKIVNDKLFMATPSKLVLFDPKFLIDYKADIKHIATLGNYLYVFTNDGHIIKLDSDLKVIKKIKLPFASFFAPSVCNGNIWTVEKEGYLIKITPDLKVSVYTGNNFDTSSYSMLKMQGCKIYNDDKVFMIE